MTNEHDFTAFNETNPQILFQSEGPTRLDVWFSPAECRVDELMLKDVCNDLYQRSHGAIMINVTDLNYGVLTIVCNPTIQTKIGLEEAAKRLARRLCETCSQNEHFRPELFH